MLIPLIKKKEVNYYYWVKFLNSTKFINLILVAAGYKGSEEEQGLRVLEMGEGQGLMERVRLRLVFDSNHILSNAQKQEGLKKSWFLFKPKITTTISDLAENILFLFDLHSSCPHGIILSVTSLSLPYSNFLLACLENVYVYFILLM